MIETIVTAVLSFIATNIDDVFIIIVLFARVSSTFTRSHIYAGQYLGFLALVVLSIIGSFSKLFIPEYYIGFLGLIPIYLGIRELWESFVIRKDDDEDLNLSFTTSSKSKFFITGVLSVASITIANGSDNIGIYIPLFATQDLASLTVTVLIFLILVYPLVRISEHIATHPALESLIKKTSPVVFPLVLIGLGVYIIVESGSWQFVIALFS
jgi:cadmium resistance transport/sequestration family protein